MMINNLSGGWQREFIGRDKEVLFFPDANANYWLFKMDREHTNKKIGLRVVGEFPKSRYMSVNVYDDKKFTPIACITDIEVKADEGSKNPFIHVSESNDKNTYTVNVVPKNASHKGGTNVVEYSEDLSRVSIILRYYLPEGDDYGAVELPEIEAFDIETGEKVERPQFQGKETRPVRQKIRETVRDSVIKNVMRPIFLLNRKGDLNSYHISGNAMYPNKDNNYLVMPMKLDKDEVALIKFKAPKVKEQGGEGDVRYYSLGQGDDESHNLLTLSDKELKVAEDGFIYVAISDDESISAKCVEENYMQYKVSKKSILIYRNLVGEESYEGNMDKVPLFKEAKRSPAKDFIGDYAPWGKIVKVHEFESQGFNNIK